MRHWNLIDSCSTYFENVNKKMKKKIILNVKSEIGYNACGASEFIATDFHRWVETVFMRYNKNYYVIIVTSVFRFVSDGVTKITCLGQFPPHQIGD